MPPSNSTQQSKIQFKKRAISQENRPDAPEGAWEALIPKGKCKIITTPAEKGGDPVIVISFQLEKANTDGNESFQGSVITSRLTFYDASDADRRKAANANLRFARGLAEACDLELGDIYPDEVGTEDDLNEIISKIEGRRMPIWTTHRESVMGNGEKVTNIDIRFTEPGSGLVDKTLTDDNDERPGRKPAKKTKR